MSKHVFEFSNDATLASSGSTGTGNAYSRSSPLSDLVRSHLRSKGMRQVDFCRQTGFDQGLLSKILSSVVTTLNVESALRLADGLGIAPGVVFEAIGKKEIDEMLRRYYSNSRESQAT